MIRSKFKSFVRDYFTLTSRERKGAFVLALIICIQILVIIYKSYLYPPDPLDLKSYQPKILQFENRIAENQYANEKKTNAFHDKYKEKNSAVTLKDFNPNTITDTEWMQLGLSEKQTRIVRNYLQKGGVFRTKESLSKIYGVSPQLFARLEPYIQIPKIKNNDTKNYVKETPAKRVNKKINLNTADTLELQGLPLIGPGRARMIYKYREALGGFHHIGQLFEVFTMDSATIERITPLIEIDTTQIRKLNINADSLKHPYLSKQIVNVIRAYRKQHGAISGLNQLRQISLMENEMYSKLVPYLTFE